MSTPGVVALHSEYEACVCSICAFPGEALLESNTVIDFVYCSPSLRCVQTAQNILKGEKSLLDKESNIHELNLSTKRSGF